MEGSIVRHIIERKLPSGLWIQVNWFGRLSYTTHEDATSMMRTIRQNYPAWNVRIATRTSP